MPDPWKGQKNDKLVFVGLCPDYLSLRTSAHAGVAIPQLEGKCIDNCPTKAENYVFLVVIVTWFHSTGGLPHQSADWFAMTEKTYKHQFTGLPWVGRHERYNIWRPL